MRRATPFVLLLTLLLCLLSLHLDFGVSSSSYYFDFDIAVAPTSPSTHDAMNVTVSFNTSYVYENPASFSPLSQSGHNFSIIVEVYPWPDIAPAFGHEEETYHLGNLVAGPYSFNVDVQVWSGLPGDISRMLLDSASYSEFFTVDTLTITVPDDYLTIQEAINATSDGDTVFVRNGTYYEHVVVNKTISLKGENPCSTIIVGTVDIQATRVEIRRLCVENGQGIRVEDATQCRITETVSRNSTTCGISLLNTSNSEISFNNISSNYYDGILLDHTSNSNVILSNHIQGFYRDGIGIHGSSLNVVEKNVVSGDTYWTSSGLHIRYASNNTVKANSIMNCATGIWADTSHNNTIYHNNFINTTVEASLSGFPSNTWDNGCEGNYWSNYNGTDLGNDGVGDTYLPWEGVDNYPLMNPYWNPADIDHDQKVNIFDVVKCAIAYGSTPLDSKWNPHGDIAEPYGIIDIFDLVMIASSYGEEHTP